MENKIEIIKQTGHNLTCARACGELKITSSQFYYICKKFNIRYKKSKGGKKFGAHDRKPRKRRLKRSEILREIQSNYPNDLTPYFRDMDNVVIEKLSDIKQQLEYIPNSGIKKFSEHIGQRKLFLNELQFLTKVDTKYCVYAGSAPGYKTYYLSSLFPDIKLILIDPNKFDLKLPKSHRLAPHPHIIHLKYNYPTKSNAAAPDDIINFIKTTNYRIYIIEDYMDGNYAKLFRQLDCWKFLS